MTNDRLRDALSRNALTLRDVADQLMVDPKTVERWVTTGRVPYPRHRGKLVALVGEPEAYLWPTAVPASRRAQVAESELIHLYPHRASVPIECWRRLISCAEERLDILMYSGMFLVDQIPRIGALLRGKAESGVKVRILVGDPDSRGVLERGREEGIGDALAAKVRNVLVEYRSIVGVVNTEVRLHSTTLYNSIYRFDDEMLVNSHIFGFPAAHAPVLHLRRLSTGSMFQTYADSFEQVWSHAAHV